MWFCWIVQHASLKECWNASFVCGKSVIFEAETMLLLAVVDGSEFMLSVGFLFPTWSCIIPLCYCQNIGHYFSDHCCTASHNFLSISPGIHCLVFGKMACSSSLWESWWISSTLNIQPELLLYSRSRILKNWPFCVK